jgi:hypothetical protein
LLGPVNTADDRYPWFISAYGSKTTFTADTIWAEDAEDLRLKILQARNDQSRAALWDYCASCKLADALNQAGITPEMTRH